MRPRLALGIFLGILALSVVPARAQALFGGSGLPFPIINGDCIIGSGGAAIWGSCSGSSSSVTGPGSSTNGYLPEWNGTAGNALSAGIPLASLLQSANNLSDLASAATARTNLGLGALATESALTAGQLPGLASGDLWLGNGSGVATATALSGDCTLANTGALTCTKTNGAAFGSLAMLSSLPLGDIAAIGADTVLGNATGASAAPTALSQAQLTALCDPFTSTLLGCVPASGGGTTNFLRADGTWAAPPGGGSTTLTLAPGLGNSAGTYNPGTQTVTNGGTVYPQFFYYGQASSCTVNSTCAASAANDSGYALTATAAGLTFTMPNPGAVGSAPQSFGYDGTHSYTLTTSGGAASIYGCGVSGVSITASYPTQLISDGANYMCVPNVGSPSGVTAGSYTSANITVNAQGLVTAASNGSGGGGGQSVTSLPADSTSFSQGRGTLLMPSLNFSGGQGLSIFTGTIYYLVFYNPLARPITTATLQVDAAYTGGASDVYVWLYSLGSTGLPNSLIADFGQACTTPPCSNTSLAATGAIQTVAHAAVNLTANTYYIVAVETTFSGGSGTPTLDSADQGGIDAIFGSYSASIPISMLAVAGSYTSAPATAPTPTSQIGANSNAPIEVWVK